MDHRQCVLESVGLVPIASKLLYLPAPAAPCGGGRQEQATNLSFPDLLDGCGGLGVRIIRHLVTNDVNILRV